MSRRLVSTSSYLAMVLAGCAGDGSAVHVETVPADEEVIAPATEVDVDAEVEAAVEIAVDETSPEDPAVVDGVALRIDQDEVAPQSIVALRIDAADGIDAPTDVQWSVYLPHATEPTRIGTGLTIDFEANFVGAYRFLAEYTRDGQLVQLSRHLMVVAGQGLHIELSWQTPGDPDETDTGTDPSQSVGSDVDVHLLYPSATKFFDPFWDCFWRERSPEWGAIGAADNPALDRDDQDGGGPEIITIPQPEVGAEYRVGVHYWNDWGYGVVFATIRVFVDGALVETWSDVELNNDDLWASHTIVDGVVTRVGDTAATITHAYTTLPE